MVERSGNLLAVIHTPRKSRRALFAGLLVLVLLASACSSSNDPNSWTEAGIDGSVRPNFVEACKVANTGSGQLTDQQANSYCTQAFEALVDYYGGRITQPGNVLQDSAGAAVGRDFAAFLKLDSDLRKDPTSIPPEITTILHDIETAITN